MFTGIVQVVGQVGHLVSHGADTRLTVVAKGLDPARCRVGDSIAVNGVCLTVVTLHEDAFTIDVSLETLQRSSLGQVRVGSQVNLEQALTLSTPLGGHLMSGHVDGVGTITEREAIARSWRFRVAAPPPLARYIAEKGSIGLDGISLTVNTVTGSTFDVNVVPHTFAETIMPNYTVGTKVNLEVDMIARYLERLLRGDNASGESGTGMTVDWLIAQGYGKR